jgi:hypothetical protein
MWSVSLNIHILTFFLIGSAFAQSYKSSIIAEIGGLSTSQTDYFSDKKDGEFIGAFALSYNGKVMLSPHYQLEITAGYLGSFIKNDYFFSGIKLGLFIKRDLFDSLFFALGIDSKLTFEGGHGTVFYTDPKRLTFFIGSKIGCKLNKDFSILLTYLKTLEEYSGYGQNYQTAYKKYLHWIIKLGIEYYL